MGSNRIAILRRIVLMGALLALGGAVPASAVTLNYIIASRQLSVSADALSPGGNDSDSLSADDFTTMGLFQDVVSVDVLTPSASGVSSASQSSTLGSLSMDGFGSAAGSGSFPPPTTSLDVYATSTFRVNFSVDEDAPYHLDIRLTVSEDPATIFSFANVSLIEDPLGTVNFLVEASQNATGEKDLAFDGVLMAGVRYALVATALEDWDTSQLTGWSGTGTSGYQFAFSVIPEPSSVSLLALGLVGIAAVRRGRVA